VISVLDEYGLARDIFESSDNTSYNFLDGMSLEDAKALIQETEGYGILHIKSAGEEKTSVAGLTFYSEESWWCCWLFIVYVHHYLWQHDYA